jgi:hypothetical protein
MGYRRIQSLDPSRLLPSDFIDLSSWREPSIRATPKSGEQAKAGYRLRYSTLRRSAMPFPDKTQGFMYYHNPLHDVLPISGQVRFRLTASKDPFTFAAGTDLLTPSGLLWRIPLMAIAQDVEQQQGCNALQQLLLDDKLVTMDVLRQCIRIRCAPHCRPSNASRIVHTLGDPFPVKFANSTAIAISVVTNDSYHRVLLHDLFAQGYQGVDHVRPFSGKPPRPFYKVPSDQFTFRLSPVLFRKVIPP